MFKGEEGSGLVWSDEEGMAVDRIQSLVGLDSTRLFL
jgi:hypothetical protein